MTQYRHTELIGVVVEAEEFDGDRIPALIDVDGDNTATDASVADGRLTLDSRSTGRDGDVLYARQVLSAGWWVVLMQTGDLFGVPGDTFAQLYEPVVPAKGAP